MKGMACAGGWWLLGCSMLAAQAPDPAREATFVLQELATGVHAALVVPRPPHYAFANSLIVDLGDGLLVVDTQQSPGAAAALIAEIRRRWKVPVRFVVNTHWHGDHVLGNGAYREAYPDVEIIGHVTHPEDITVRTRAQVDKDLEALPAGIAQANRWLAEGRGPDGAPLTEAQRGSLNRSLALRRAQLEVLRTIALVPPTRLVADGLALGGPRRSVHVLAVGPAHTRGDLIVWLPGERILAAGDLVEDAWPWVDGADVPGWVTALDRLAGLDPAVVLPAHGRPWHEPRPRLAAQAAALRAGCAAVADSTPPAPVLALGEALHLPADGAVRFWRQLAAAAALSPRCPPPHQ